MRSFFDTNTAGLDMSIGRSTADQDKDRDPRAGLAEPQTGDIDSADEATMLLHWAREEILSLRREISRLAPKAEAYDLLLSFSQIIPGKPMGYAEDVAWKIERFLNPETGMGQTRPA